MITPLTSDDVNTPPEYEVRWKADTDWQSVRELENAARNGDAQAFEELNNVLNNALIRIDPVTGKEI